MTDNLAMFEPDELIALAAADLERSDYESALRKLKTAVQWPDVPNEALGMIARVYAQLRLWEKARDFYRRYLERVPEAATETFQLGMVHFDMGEAEEALSIWQALLARQPTHPPALFFAALANAQQGRRNDAARHLDVLLKSAPADNLYFGRGKELLQALESETTASGAAGAALGGGH